MFQLYQFQFKVIQLQLEQELLLNQIQHLELLDQVVFQLFQQSHLLVVAVVEVMLIDPVQMVVQVVVGAVVIIINQEDVETHPQLVPLKEQMVVIQLLLRVVLMEVLVAEVEQQKLELMVEFQELLLEEVVQVQQLQYLQVQQLMLVAEVVDLILV